MMVRRTLIAGILASFVSVTTCFTTTPPTSNYCNNNRKQDLNDRSIKVFHIHTKPAFSSTLLFEVKESTTVTTDSAMLDGVVELGQSTTTDIANEETKNSSPGLIEQAVAPFFSQGEIDPQTLNPDLSDPKQARVIIYIILSLLPVLFLIPLMIGSRDLIPLDAVAPVQL